MKGVFKLYNNNNTKKEKLQVFEDTNKRGKPIDWRGKKLDTNELSKSYARIGQFFKGKAERTGDCGDFLEFTKRKDDSLALTRANFCKVRLCPMCSWRRSLKLFGQVSRVMDHAEENHNFRYLFLTLTVKNCYEEDFKETLDNMTKAFNKMTRRKKFKSAIKGYFRALEVTYNPIDDSYHPHFHIIFAVSTTYFKDQYINQKEWGNLWKDCLNVDYDPIVDIRALKKNNKKEVSEVAKYTVKSDDFLIKEDGKINEEITDKVVKTLDLGLHRKRLVSFGFIFKDIHKKLNLDDAEQGDLVNTDNEEIREDLTDTIIRVQWNIGFKNYFIREIIESKE